MPQVSTQNAKCSSRWQVINNWLQKAKYLKVVKSLKDFSLHAKWHNLDSMSL